MLIFSLFSASIIAQTTITGTVTDASTGEGLAGVNIIVKGKVVGTISDTDGKFFLEVGDNPPLTLTFSFIGFETQEVVVNESNATLNITLNEQTLLGQEIVVSASRVEESILESPVSIEKMDRLAVQNTSADNYYKGIANLKGVDVATSSINFQIINARGFASTGNTRFVQLIDGMDTQAPALNFPIGNLNGPSELDVESVELIPGASSALYGPNAFNGILLINSKSPFEYQGLSAFAKLGVNHIGDEADRDPAPLYEASIRYAKAYNNKFAFKVNFSYMRAEDWQGTSAFDRNAGLTPEGYSFNPGSDRLHFMGDEASTNLGFLGFAAQTAFAVEGTPQDNDTFSGLRALFRGTNTDAFEPGLSAANYLTDIPSQTVSRTPYEEESLIDYGAENIKANVGLFYRLNDQLELSYLFNGGWGTSIYTGAQRYSLSNFGIQQHRLQLRGDNFFVRAYGTFENSGDSYITEFLALQVNESFAPNNTWFANYTANYLSYIGGTDLRGGQTGAGLSPGEIASLPFEQRIQVEQAAHMYARSRADLFRFEQGSVDFEQARQNALGRGPIPLGPSFNDNTRMYHVEGQYDFKNEIDFMDLQVGANYRLYDLRSDGTIFPDQDGGIQISEYGAYAQVTKRVFDDKLKLIGSLRYDKNENFDGQINPRIAGVWSVAKNHNIRASFQTGFRFPTTQGQYIDLNVISARLIGGLPEVSDKYQVETNSYTALSVNNYSRAVFEAGSTPAAIYSNLNLLERFTYTPVEPEKVKTFELGYKSIVDNKLLIDVAYYYNIYNDFITQVQFRKAPVDVLDPALDPSIAIPAASSLLSGSALGVTNEGVITGNTGQIYTNYDQQISSQGAVLGLTYNLPRNFTLSGNYNWNRLNDQLVGGLSEFNTPEHKFNISFANRKVTDLLGFNITYRWQEAFIWESSFAQGPVPAYGTLDAQISLKIKDWKSIVKLGGSNLVNEFYIQSLGGPRIGAIYYISLTFDELMN
jgi:outer membrane receptor protein involved in Fe transport